MWKNIIFSSGNCKKGLQFCIGKWKIPYEKVSWGEENLSITHLHSYLVLVRCLGCDHTPLLVLGIAYSCIISPLLSLSSVGHM
jgi:hypothetical protein